MKRDHIIKIAILVLVLLGCGSFLYQYIQLRNKDKYYGIPYYKKAPDFTLTDHNGNRVSLSQFRGKLILIAWRYTHCPDICPLILSMLKGVMNKLGNEQDKVQVLFINVDPKRDTPERLRNYVPSFYNGFLGLTGTPQEIKECVEAYDVFFISHGNHYGRSESDTWDTYLMTHTTTIYLIDQNGRLRLTYPYDKFNSESISDDIRKILEQ